MVGVVAPGTVRAPAAMVWLQRELHTAADLLGAVGAVESQATAARSYPQCFFTIHHMPIEETALRANWLAAVPDYSTMVSTVLDAMQATEVLRGSVAVESWLKDVTRCVWPSLCELPLNATLPAELIKPPAGRPWVCAWAVSHGHGESAPACQRIDMSTARVILPKFTRQDEAQPTDNITDVNVITEVGHDDRLGATVVLARSQRNGLSGGLLSAPAALRVYLDRTHPLQYRTFAVSATPQQLIAGGVQVLDDAVLSAWQDLSVSDPSPQVLYPPPGYRWPAEHAFFGVDVRLLVGINRWSQLERSLCVALVGRHPELVAEQRPNRTIALSSTHPNSTLVYRWTLGLPQEPQTNDGLIHRVAKGFHAFENAYKLDVPIARLQPTGALASDWCKPAEGVDELEAEARFGPRLCIGKDAAILSAPDGRRWGLWAAAYSAGLDISPATTLTVHAQCVLSIGIRNAGTPPCAEGHRIDSGTTCAARCRKGHSAAEPTLACNDGTFTPASFQCTEDICNAPSGINHTGALPCREGNVISSRGICTTQCSQGYVPSKMQLECSVGVLSPITFVCNERSCAAPYGIRKAHSMPCVEGISIEPGGLCTPQCQPGYTPSEYNLVCSTGSLSPLAFTCAENPCDAPGYINYSALASCSEE